MTFSGTAKLLSNSNLGLISANPLFNRTVTLQRAPLGSSTWTNVATDSVAFDGVWSVVATSTTGGIFQYRGRFAGETGLASGTSNVYNVQWITLGCPS